MAAKVPYPRQLTSAETLDTLTHWRSHVRNYFRRDENLKEYFARGKTWDSTRDNYGFAGEDAATKADYLEGLLDTISGFMPGPYLTARITKNTTSMQSVFDVIWEHYDVDPNPSTFLDFAELELTKDERYIDLFYRMIYHAEMHLLKAGTLVEGKALVRDESLSCSHKNLITVNWLQTLDSNLLSIVKLEKHQDLKDGKQICTLVNDIAKNVDEWLKRHGCKPPVRSQDTLTAEPQVRNVRFEGYNKPATRGNGRGQFRGRGFRGNNNRGQYNNRSNSRFPSNQQFSGPRRFCPGCNYLAQELQVEVNFRHFPSECPRKQSVLRMLRAQDQQFEDDDNGEDEHVPEEEELQQEDNYEGMSVRKVGVNDVCLESNQVEKQKLLDVDTNVDCINEQGSLNNDRSVYVDRQLTGVSFHDKNDLKDANESISLNFPSCVNAVWKSKSPTIEVYIQDQKITAVIDEGSEISAIDYDVVLKLNLSISRTIEAAQAAGSRSLNIIGKTAEDVIVKKNIIDSNVTWNLGQCLVVKQLGCDALIGEPAKEKNHIVTHPVSKTITTVDNMSNKVILFYSSSSQNHSKFSEKLVHNGLKNKQLKSSTVRFNRTENIYPNNSVSILVPSEFKTRPEVLVEPTEFKKFPAPGIYSIHHGMIKVENSGNFTEQLKKNDVLIFSSLRKVDLTSVSQTRDRPSDATSVSQACDRSADASDSSIGNDDIHFDKSTKLIGNYENICGNNKDTCASKNNKIFSRKVYDINRKAMDQFIYPHVNAHVNADVLEQVSIDPDNRLSQEFKQMFTDIIRSYSDMITPIPGRYNGYYGQVNCALTLTNNPPPSLKPRLPNYSDEKLNILAKLIDDMEEWGVVVKPEKIGVVPTHVHPCILVPKDDGKFRLVTDFRSLQSYVRQLPTVMPTTSEAMTALSSADYHIELDFSNYYWQNSIPREDSEKLAICHPFGGLRVYTVCPQGLRNSAEWGSEILARIFGDMVQDKRCTRIADQIYVLGNSVSELLENFKVVMQRARNSNLTFKPSKIIVCPLTTIILGWKKNGSQWSPTEHVLSPLSQAEPPSTVKKLRGWLGAYRQIAKTIPNHSVMLQQFEKLVGGKNSRDKIPWSPELIAAFDIAKSSIATSAPITIPRPTDQLVIYPDWSQDADAVGGRLVIERQVGTKKESLHGGEFSCRLKGAQARWTPCEKECLAIKLLVQHYQPFIRESVNKSKVYR